MEEETCHVRRTTIVLTYPLCIIGNCEPIFQVSSNLTREVVTLEFILTMTNQTLLAKNSTTEVVVHLASATTKGNVMLGRRNTRLIHLLEPVGIIPRTCVHTPRLISIITLPCCSNLFTWCRSAIDMVFDLIQHILAEWSITTTICSSIIPIACEVI